MKQAVQIRNEIKAGKYIELFRDIYVDENMIPYQTERYDRLLEEYIHFFGEDEVEIYSAAGRSEIGGNHTDHQHGRVLAASINLDAVAVASKREDGHIWVKSEGYPMIELLADDTKKRPDEEGTSAGLIRGILASLEKRGYRAGGFCACVMSDVLNGAGLSSSAAFETVIGTILSGLYNNMRISMAEIAQAGQYAENVYFGKPCGLMDQTACAVGGLIYIDFLDPAHPSVKKLNIDFETYKYSLCIVDTKSSHDGLTGDFAQIPLEMKKIAAYFKKEVLRNVDAEEFYREISSLRKEFGDRPVLRAIHFFEENERVASQAAALDHGEFAHFLELARQSGDSSFKYLQNIYINRDVQNQSMSIALAMSEKVLGNHGVCRVHGGGFAGTIQAFVENDFVETYRRTLDYVFGEGSCRILKVRKYGGMQVL